MELGALSKDNEALTVKCAEKTRPECQHLKNKNGNSINHNLLIKQRGYDMAGCWQFLMMN